VSGCLLRTLWITACAGILATACGGDDDPGHPDAGAEISARLVILEPPGDAIGLMFGDGATLRVRYETDAGEPIAGAPIGFGFVISPTEAAGGAALSATTASTDDDGIAEIDVVAGAERANFRVRATAERALPATFYVAVSNVGFADLIVHPWHEGWRAVEEFSQVQMRVYRRSIVTCDDIDIDDPPESVFPPRAMPGFIGRASFPNLGALEPYTLLSWGEIEAGGTRVAYGCTTLSAAQLQPGPDVLVEPAVVDRALVLPADSELTSVIDLAPVAAAVADESAVDAWRILACPSGPGQLLLDCALDAAATTVGDATDCVLDDEAALDPLVQALAPVRGVVAANGCRPASGLDHTLTDAMAGSGPWPSGAALTQLLDARRAIASRVRLTSVLSPVAPGVARHELTHARFDADPGTHTIWLTSTARPVLVQHQVAADVAGDRLEVGAHGFTLRLGSASQEAFLALGLEPHGLGARTAELGQALAETVAADTDTGCPAFSAIVCEAVGEPASCLEAACAQAAANLDERFHDWWRALDADGLDLWLSGTAPLYDFDDDLLVDSVAANNGGLPEGTWSAVLHLADGAEVEATGTFGAVGPE